jgi:hypothetical protein
MPESMPLQIAVWVKSFVVQAVPICEKIRAIAEIVMSHARLMPSVRWEVVRPRARVD